MTHEFADPLPSTHPLSLRHKGQPFQMSSPRLHRHALTADRSVVGTRCRECLWSWSEISEHERTDAVMSKTTERICSNHRFTHTTAQTTQILLFGYLDTRKRKIIGKAETSDTKLTLVYLQVYGVINYLQDALKALLVAYKIIKTFYCLYSCFTI